MPCFVRLQHKAHACIVALVLNAGKPAATTLEAHAAGFAYADAVEGAVGASGERLGEHGIQVLAQPRDPQLFREGVKGILGKAVALPQRREGCFALLGMCAGDGRGPPVKIFFF